MLYVRWLSKLPNVRGEYKFSEPLKKYTWLNVGGAADVMYFPQDEADLQYFMQNKPRDVPYFILGGGSNLLVRDGGIDGVVIKLNSPAFKSIKYENGMLYCGAGLPNAMLKTALLSNHIGGFEFICSIPGTMGGLVRTNAGCFGTETSQLLQSARIMTARGEIKTVSAQELNLSYRRSNFPADWIVLELCFEAKQSSDPQKILAILAEQKQYRNAHQPQGIRTAGSTFKNPEGADAWKLVKEVGGDKLKIGGAAFSAKHCNFLENDGTATAADIEKLGSEVVRRVKSQSGIDLEWEVKIIGRK